MEKTKKTTVVGLQVAGVANINAAKATIYGLQIALVNVNTQPEDKGYFSGLSGPSGLSHGSDYGHAYGAVYGIQLGLYNSTAEIYGFQIGLINVASKLHGIQIGLINFNKEGPFSVSPIFNVGF